MTLKSSKIEVGLIGAGAVAGLHLDGLYPYPDLRVSALAEKDMPYAQKRARDLGIKIAYDDYRALLDNSKIDVVHILLPDDLHFDVMAEAIDKGKHIVAEKPLTRTLNEAVDLVLQLESSEVLATVNFHYRYFHLVHKVRELIERGELGEIRLFHGSYLQDWLMRETDYNWRLDPRNGVSGAVADIGSHWFDLVQYLIGRNITKVFARMDTVIPVRKKILSENNHKNPDYEEIQINIEDNAIVLMELEGGIPGNVTISQVAPGRQNRLYFEISGSKASVSWNWENPNELWIGYRDKPNQVLTHPELFKPAWRGGIQCLFVEFYRDVRELKSGLGNLTRKYPTFRDGLRSVKIVDAVCKSARNNQWVEIEENRGLEVGN